MPSINISLDFFDHPKVRRLVGTLGRGAEVLPIRLWTYCGKFHLEDGALADYSIDEIEAIAQWWGEKGKMVETLVKIGFLDQCEDGFYVHDWEDHERHLLSYKIKAKKGAKERWKGHKIVGKRRNASSNAPSNAKGNANAVQCSAMQYIHNPPNPLKPEKLKFGQLKNVYLTDDEFEKLKQKLGGHDNAMVMVERLSLYVASKGDKYKSHYATMLNWDLKDNGPRAVVAYQKPPSTAPQWHNCPDCGKADLVNLVCPLCKADYSERILPPKIALKSI